MNCKLTAFLVATLVMLALPMTVFGGGDADEDENIIDASGQWKYIMENGCATITGYAEEPEGDLVIPSKVDSYPVTSIGPYTFYECHGLTSVIIPESITHIGSGAFSSCFGLTEVTIPEGVTGIGSYAFERSGLKDVTIPHSVASIDDYAFAMCDNLAITIPASVEYNEFFVFWDCINLTLNGINPDAAEPIEPISTKRPDMNARVLDIYLQAKREAACYVYSIDANEEWFYYPKDNGAILLEPMKTLSNDIMIPSELESHAINYGRFPERDKPIKVTHIKGAMFFENSDLHSVTIADGIVNIGPVAFAYCSSLTHVTIPASIESIGEYAFEGCENLTLSVTKGSFAEQYAREQGILYIHME